MDVLFLLITGLLGLIIGSFLNVLIIRKSVRKSLYGRSRCMKCRKTLSPLELIPVVSFAIQKGRCRRCGVALLWQYPLVELLMAVLFVAATHLFFPDFLADGYSVVTLLLFWAGIAAGIVILVTDIRSQIIPDYAVAILFILGVFASFSRVGLEHSYYAWYYPNPFAADWIAALLISGFFASLWFFSKGRWMGFGDAKLILATSLIVGFPASLVAFLFSFWIGALFGIVVLCREGGKLKSKIPFGPFILIATALAYFFTDYFLAFNTLFII